MPLLCDSLCRSQFGRISCAWLVIVFAIASPLFADPPQENPSSAKSIWSEELPAVETRIHWAWPEFLSRRWTFDPLVDAASVPLARSEPKPHYSGKLFGLMDWFRQTSAPNAIPRIVEPAVIRAKGGESEALLFSDASPADYRVTLVQNASQLFGARGRIRGEYGNDFDDLKRIRGQVLWTFNGRVGVDASVNSWQQKRSSPRTLGDFWTGDANFVYSMGAKYIAMRGGVGAAWIKNKNFDVGYNLTYGADLYLKRPFLASAEVDWGKITGDKLFHYRGTVGVQLMRFEVYVGYDSYRLGHLHFNGPVAGAGIWF